MHISSEQMHGAQMADTSLQRDGGLPVVTDGKGFTADSRIDMEEPAREKQDRGVC